MTAIHRIAAAAMLFVTTAAANAPAAAEDMKMAALSAPSVQTLLETAVVGEHGQVIGSVEGVIARADGSPQYLYLSLGGFFGIGAEGVLMPWGSVRYDSKEQFLRVEERALDQRETMEMAVD